VGAEHLPTSITLKHASTFSSSLPVSFPLLPIRPIATGPRGNLNTIDERQGKSASAMGNQSSMPLVDDDTPPQTLERRDIESVADYIKGGNVRQIVVLTGAGVSTSAGIPDFRSPDTGIYANLARLNLPNPQAVFDISFFRKNPLPFYALARELFPGRFSPTIAHLFIKLLYDKGRLLKLFTQNIDCLEREAGVPGEMVIEAHGSFATQSCIDCKTAYSGDLMKKAIDAGDVPLCVECGGLVKPDIVFFGESLPSAFFENRELMARADLCIIMGTSLSVQPFASLPYLCREGVPRVLINMEPVGGLGTRPDDVLLLGECDEGARRLADALGWRDKLEALWAKTCPEKAKLMEPEAKPSSPETRDGRLRDEIDRLVEEVEQALHISRSHNERTREQLLAKEAKEAKETKENQRKITLTTDQKDMTITERDVEVKVESKEGSRMPSPAVIPARAASPGEKKPEAIGEVTASSSPKEPGEPLTDQDDQGSSESSGLQHVFPHREHPDHDHDARKKPSL